MSIVNFSDFQKKHQEKQLYSRWISFYMSQPHEELLEALVYEHENDFPLRRSPVAIDQQRHKALVAVLQERAQTEFLKTFLGEINGRLN